VLFTALLVLIGLVARGRAAAFPAEEMFRSFPDEDGYLMLTVARNIALGRGMSSGAGTLPTNGVQPLATFLQAACFRAVGAEREPGVRLLIVVYTAVALLTALLVYALGLELLAGWRDARRAALLAAAVWFTSPVTLFHSMNMLETGLYAAAVAAVAWAFARAHAGEPGPWPWRRCLRLGMLLGLAFWARNDAVFLMVAVGLAHLATASRSTFGRRLAETAAIAGAALAVSLPWLAYGLSAFGSLVPVSGRAYLGRADVAANASAAAVALFEHASLLSTFAYQPIQHHRAFVAACAAGAMLAALGIVVAIARAGGTRGRKAALTMPVVFGAALLAFYVLFFAAPHFLRRYLFPLSPFLAVAWGAAAAWLWRRAAASPLRMAGPVALLLALGHFAIRDGLLVRGPWRRDALFRGVEWVEAHLGADTWVGAFQSGTLGFFHDHTINLDGKVNPQALAAIRASTLAEYVADSPIEFVVDWASIVEPWARGSPLLARRFEWVVRDPAANFAVLGRRGSRPPGGGG
jgi:hypothetical protein